MQYREYGRTGKKISVLSAGGMRYAEPKKIDESARIMLEAARAGVNYFDTAPGYSEDKSETILGAAVREMKKENLEHYIATKTWAHDTDTFWKHLENSLKTLDVQRIDFYHAWGVNDRNSFNTRKEKNVINAFREAKEKGMIGHVVCSSHMSGPEIAEMVREGLFEGILLGYCAVNFPFRIEGVRAAHAMKMGVVTMNPLGGGMITEYPDRFDFIRTRPKQDVSCLGSGTDVKDPGDGQSMLEAALQFNLSHPEITSALVGFRTVEDVKTAIKAVSDLKPLTADEMENIKSHIEKSFDQLCTTCNYCRDCPEGIPVVRLMEAYNHYMLYGKDNSVFDRLKWHWGINDIGMLESCTECRQCEDICTQKLPVLERFNTIRELDKKRPKEKKS